MHVRPFAHTMVSLTLFAILGCGGSSKPAETGGTDTKAAGEMSEAPSEASPSEPGDSEAKSEKPGAPKEEKVSIPAGLQMLDRRSLTLEFDLNLMKKGEGKGVQSGN